MRLPVGLLLLVLSARVGIAQVPDPSRAVAGAAVRGTVYDSLARAPLAGAMVQLVDAEDVTRFARTVYSDSLGRFAFSEVPEGRYALGFFHPILDSLGFEQTVREVRVPARSSIRADLAIPPATRLRAVVCGVTGGHDAGSTVVGIARDARDGAPAAGATVVGEWLELSVNRAAMTRRTPRLVATAAASGWFVLCDLPGEGTIALSANRGADSTDRIELEIPADGFVRRDLHLAPRRGDEGRLRGIVVGAFGGRPIAGAHVSIADGPHTVANERGEWTLVGAPLGTRVLEIRAVGHAAERTAVDVVPDGPPIITALVANPALLDTVVVQASPTIDARLQGFAARRRGGLGRYLTPEDVERRQPRFTTDLFRTVPGVRVERAERGETRVTMRDMFAERCAPAIYVDDMYLGTVSGDDIDDWVRPDEVAGIEIYASGTSPPEYQPGLSACGSILIWTKMRPPIQTPWMKRVYQGLVMITVGLLIGALFRQF